MSPLAMRRLSRRFSAHGGVLLAVIALSGAIAMHHSVVSAGDMHHEGGTAAAVELCLGVMAAGAAAVAVAMSVAGLGRWGPLEILAANGLPVAVRSPVPRIRGGPAFLSLLCVRRR